ncbi:MAG: hypothetical protein ACLVKN_21390 [Flavonifractor plautii]
MEQVGRGAGGLCGVSWWFGHDTAYLAPCAADAGDGEIANCG